MKDFQLRNETRLLFRNDPVRDIAALTAGKNVLFVYGSGSVKKNGCWQDVCTAVQQGGGILFELPGASREFAMIEKGIQIVKEDQIDLVIGAGGASIMDCSKLIAFCAYHEAELWDYIKMRRDPYGLEKLPLILMPTYPSSGSEYGLGAVSADARTGDFGTAYGIAADIALLVPKYSLSLNAEMTAYTGLVTLVQLSAATLGDRNAVSYDIGVSVMRNVLKAVMRSKAHPQDMDARGTILYGASLSTSSRLGLGKEENYAYDLYEVEFLPEVLFGVPYRRSLTTIFPRFLHVMARYHEADIRRYFADVFGFQGPVEDSVSKMIGLFEEIGIPMYFNGNLSMHVAAEISIDSMLSNEERFALLSACMK